MADRNQAARGPQKGSFNLRSKVGSFEWGGMMPDTDPASLPMNRLRFLANGRFRGGGVIPRGGQQKANANALQAADARVDGLFDFQVGTRRSLYVITDGCPGISSSIGFSIGWADHEQSPFYQPGVYYNDLTNAVRAAVFGSELFVSSDNKLRKLRLIDAPYGSPALGISGSSQDITVVTFTGFTEIVAMLAFDGLLLVALDDGAGGGAVHSWDDITKREDLASIDVPTGMGLWRDKLILGFDASTNEIQVRDRGASPGSWTSVPPAAGTVAFREGISYRDKFYFTSADEDVWVYDGTTLSVAHNLVGATTFGIAELDGFLFVAYNVGASARIARFDGSSWVDIHKNITTQSATVTALRSMAAYRSELWVGALKGGAGTMFQTVDANTAGTWLERPLSGTGVTNGDIDQMLVY